MSNMQPLLDEIKRLILVQEPRAEIILYGSFARGENRSDSDLDILILLDKEYVSRDDEKKLSHQLYDLELNTNQVISPLIRSKKKWYEIYPNTPLFQNIKREGIHL